MKTKPKQLVRDPCDVSSSASDISVQLGKPEKMCTRFKALDTTTAVEEAMSLRQSILQLANRTVLNCGRVQACHVAERAQSRPGGH
jgi:hypothetical protein